MSKTKFKSYTCSTLSSAISRIILTLLLITGANTALAGTDWLSYSTSKNSVGKDTAYVFTAVTLEADAHPGLNSSANASKLTIDGTTKQSIKVRTASQSLDGVKDGKKGFILDVNDSYEVTGIKLIMKGKYNVTYTLEGVYVDDDFDKNYLTSTITSKEKATSDEASVTGLSAKAGSKIKFYFTQVNGTETGSQVELVAQITYTRVASTAAHTWNFSNWSEATLANMKTDADNWHTNEKDGGRSGNDAGVYYSKQTGESGNILFTANGTNVAETYPLQFDPSNSYSSYGVVYNLVSTTVGTYVGSQYLWLYTYNNGDVSKSSKIVIPNVKAGSTIKFGLESHKNLESNSEARGVIVSFSGNSSTTYKKTATTYDEFSITVPSEDEVGSATTDVTLLCTVGGCHIYWIDAECSDLTLKTKTKTINNGREWTITKGTDYTTSSEGAITYTSSDESVVTVDGTGAVNAVGEGQATITIAQAASGTWAADSKTINITVKAAEASLTHTWDFTNWSSETLANMAADATNWSTKEKNEGSEQATDINDGCYYTNQTTNGVLKANGVTVAELDPLELTVRGSYHAFGAAYNVPKATLGGTEYTYHGSQYLWLYTRDKSIIKLPNIKAGSTITIALGSHKYSEARGVTALFSGNSTDTLKVTTTTYEEKTITVPSASEIGSPTTDVTLTCLTGGCHIYWIDAQMSGIKLINTTKGLACDGTWTVTADVDYTNLSGAAVTYKSSDESIATVDENGVVKALKNGTVTITLVQESKGIYAFSETDITLTVKTTKVIYAKGSDEFEGTLPATTTYAGDVNLTIPQNYTMYKEGYTLTAWNDGTKDYAIGEEMTLNGTTVTLTPVFTKNAKNLNNRNSDVTVKWVFGVKNGAPATLSLQGKTGIYVAQATVEGCTIDVKMDIDATKGKVDNTKRTDLWAQLNAGTLFNIPSCSGATVTIETYGELTSTTVDALEPASKTTSNSRNVASYEVESTLDPVTISFSDDAKYISYVELVLPPLGILELSASPSTSLQIDNAKVLRKELTITLKGSDLAIGDACKFEVSNMPSSMSYYPVSFKVEDDGTVSQQVRVLYEQTAVEASGTATFSFSVGDKTSTIDIDYGRSVAYSAGTLAEVSKKTTWDWSGTTTDVEPIRDAYMFFSDVEAEYPSGVDATTLAGSAQYFAYKDSKSFMGAELYFYNTVEGTLQLEFSDTGDKGTRPYRYLNINRVNTEYKSNNTTKVKTEAITVPAGGVMIQGRYIDEPGDEATDSINFGPQYLRIYKMTFTPNTAAPKITVDNTKAQFTIKAEEGDKVYYTIDGTEPNVLTSTLYPSTAVHVSSNCIIKAIAVGTNKNVSEVVSDTTNCKLYKVKVSATPSTYGRVILEPAADNDEYTYGTDVTAIAVPNTGYAFDYWTNGKLQTLNDGIATAAASNEHTITVDTDESQNVYYAFFKIGKKGKITYDLYSTKFNDKDGKRLTTTANETQIQGWENFCELNADGTYKGTKTVEATAISIPSDYTLYLYNYTLQYWADANDVVYDLGSNAAFTEEGQEVVLHPVFKMNQEDDIMNSRTSAFTVEWDFRTGYNAQALTIEGAKTVYSTQATLDGQSNKNQKVDVDITIDATNGKYTNEQIDTWCTMTQGTEIIIPSGYGAKFTLATYAPINEVGGTTINGQAPDNVDDDEMTKNADGAYLYEWTVYSQDLTTTLHIGNDYAYYQWLRAELPTAATKVLGYSTNNSNMGTVEHSSTADATEVKGGYAFSTGADVTLIANRQSYYELKYWQDSYGNKIYENGYYVTAAGDSVNYNDIKKSTGYDYFELNNVYYYTAADAELKLKVRADVQLQAVFGDKQSFYITFTAGDYAEGLPPLQKHVEYDESFTMPDRNYCLYYEGHTLKYYEDQNGSRYDFGQTYGKAKARISEDLYLTPVFESNTKSLADITAESGVTAKWTLVRTSDNYNSIEYNGAKGVIVTQLKIDGESIDLPCHIDASSSGAKAINTSLLDCCQINKGTVFTIPTTTGCIFDLHANKGKLSKTVIAGTTNYTSDKSAIVTYTGTESEQTIQFKGEQQYFTYVSVTYMPLDEDTKPTVQSIAIAGTNLSAETLATLKSAGKMDYTYQLDDTEKMPEITATANLDGVLTITQPTLTSPTATVLLQTAAGMTITTYYINFKFSYSNAPKVVNVTQTGNKNGIISVEFNHTMDEATVIVLGQEITAASGSTLKFTYWDLTPGTYTFSINANALQDIKGTLCADAISTTFTVTDDAAVEKKPFNFVVTHKQSWDAKTQTAGTRLQVASDDAIANLKALGIGYGTIDEAVLAAENAGGSDRYYIFVPNGEYQLKGNKIRSISTADNKDGAKTDFSGYNGETWLNRNNTSIIGQSKDGTTLYNDPYVYGISYTSTVEVRAKVENFYMQDMTLDNRYSKFQVEAGQANPGGQSVAFYDRGIHTIMKNVAWKGYQDTYASNSSRSASSGSTPGFYKTYRYYEDVDVWGTVDFICGSGDAWWERPTLVLRNRATANNIVAASHFNTNITSTKEGDDYMFKEEWGYVFNKGVVKAESTKAYSAQNGKFTIGRTWQNSPAQTYLYTTYQITPSEDGYSTMSKDLVCRLHEYGSYNADGVTSADLTKRTIRDASPAAGSDDCVLTAEQAKKYTLHNVLGGDDAYDPTVYTKQVDMTGKELSLADNGLSWTDEEAALCYVVFRKNTKTDTYDFYTVTNTNSVELPESQAGETFIIRAANERGGLGEPSDSIVYEVLESFTITVSQVGSEADKGWATVCFPVNTKAPTKDVNGVKPETFVVYAATEIKNSRLYMNKVDVLNAKQGYVIYATPGTYTFVGTHADSDKSSILSGNYKSTTVSLGNITCYTLAYKSTLAGIGFYQYTGSTMKPYKAYLESDVLSQYASVGELAKGVSVFFSDDDDAATALNSIMGSAVTTRTNDKIYDLFGREVDPAFMRKGEVYIIRGVKRVW